MNMPEQKILVVDDDPDFLELLTLELRQIPGAVVTAAHNDREALGRICEKSYDLIISDWALDTRPGPGMLTCTGPDLLSRADPLINDCYARSKNGKTPVLFISGSEKIGDTGRMQSFHHFEAVSFMLKRCGMPMIRLMAGHIMKRFDGLQEKPA